MVQKSCTTWHVKNRVNNRINSLSTGAGFLPSTVPFIYFRPFMGCAIQEGRHRGPLTALRPWGTSAVKMAAWPAWGLAAGKIYRSNLGGWGWTAGWKTHKNGGDCYWECGHNICIYISIYINIYTFIHNVGGGVSPTYLKNMWKSNWIMKPQGSG